MKFTTVAWYEDLDPAAAYVGVAACLDTHITVSGDFIRIGALNNLVAVAGMLESTVAPRARLVSPSLRVRSNLMIAPLNTGTADVEPGTPQAVVDYRLSPVKLESGENLSAEILSNPGAAIEQSVVAWLADGPITPVSGNFFTVRATGATTLVAGVWGACPLTFDENLPRGRYRVVGLRPESAGCVAARLILNGDPSRPGALGCDLVSDVQHPMFRLGGLGVWGEFNDDEIPQVEFLSVVADTAEVVYLDLEKI